jgi:divalent metal cation (Fe/Co/Zn/Cd) transporter
MNQRRLFRLLWLSIAAAVATISLKATAYLVTGSVGLLSDAAESVVNRSRRMDRPARPRHRRRRRAA